MLNSLHVLNNINNSDFKWRKCHWLVCQSHHTHNQLSWQRQAPLARQKYYTYVGHVSSFKKKNQTHKLKVDAKSRNIKYSGAEGNDG